MRIEFWPILLKIWVLIPNTVFFQMWRWDIEINKSWRKLDQETWLVPDPIGWLFGQNLDYFRPYKNQVETGCKGYPIELIVNF